MKKRRRNLITAAVLVIFTVSCVLAGQQLYGQYVADQDYDQAEQLVMDRQEIAEEQIPLSAVPEIRDYLLPTLKRAEQQSLEQDARFLLEVDLEPLRAVNPDVIGWIYIPDTVVKYPLMRSADNSDYLSMTWDGSASKSGSIFLESKNRSDLSDFHTLIYGHNLRNDKMFSCLTEYQDQEYMENHRLVYIVLEDAVLRYEVFSAYTAKTDSDAYRLYFEDEAQKQSVLDEYMEKSLVETDLVPGVDNNILTLSTCTGRGLTDSRWVVHTVLTGVFDRG